MNNKSAMVGAAVMVLVLGCLWLCFAPASPPSRPAASAPMTPAEQSPKEQKVAEKPAQPNGSASVSPVPLPPPVPPTPQVEPLRPRVVKMTVSEGEDGLLAVRLSCRVDIPAELSRSKPPLLCVFKYPALGALALNTGTLKGRDYQTSETNTGWYQTGPERKSWPIIILLKGVPQTKNLVRLDGDIMLIRQVSPGATGEWDLPGAIGKSLKIGPATLKLARSSEDPILPDILTAEFETTALNKNVPGGMTLGMGELVWEDKPLTVPPFETETLREMTTGPARLLYSFRQGKKHPKAVRIVVPELSFERVPMRIENIELPRNATAAAGIPIGPRGPREVQVDGFTVVLDSVTSKREDRDAAELELKISCRGPKKPGLVSFPCSIRDLQAVTEAGDQLTLEGQVRWTPATYQSRSWSGQIHSSETVRYPKKPVDRFVSLTGRFSPLLFVEQWAEAAIEIPEGDERTRIEQDPITLDVGRQGNNLNITIRIAESGMPGPEGGWWDAVTVGCRDSGGRDFSKEVRCIRMATGRPSFAMCQCLSPKGAVKVSVKYPVKGTKKDLPFEFKDVGLPRTGGAKGTGARPENDEF